MRLIDADEVLFKFNENASEEISEDAQELYSLLVNAPNQVVRCGQCRWCMVDGVCQNTGDKVLPHHFCSWGEIKDDA